MRKLLEFITEIIGWIQIVFSPTIIGMGLGFIFYNNFQNATGLIFGILFSIIGFSIGMILATKKFKTTGTRISVTPKIDNESSTNSKK
jgi:F0F1-type ATP synthase assembly protein I